MKLKLKNVQMKLNIGSNNRLILLKSNTVAIAYEAPKSNKKTPMKRWSKTSRIF